MTDSSNLFGIRRLERSDAQIYHELRLESLERHPEAFGARLEDERDSTLDDVAGRLTRSVVFGAFDGEGLAGVAGWYRLSGDKLAHRRALWGLYVRPRARDRDLGTALVRRVLDDARTHVEQVHLTVAATNGPARRLYERTGFSSYGVEPRALKIDGNYIDEIMMVRRFD